MTTHAMTTHATTTHAALEAAMRDVQNVGMPGLLAELRDENRTYQAAVGVADVDTGEPVTADMRHRMGSISKTFVAAAVLQLVDAGHLNLDGAIGGYLPQLVPGDRGAQVTVRMLLNHTSGFAEYLPYAYPSLAAFPNLADTTPQSLEDNRLTRFDPLELISLGLSAPAVGTPGGRPGVYSNTNYLLLCQLIELVTGVPAERHITERVIERAALLHTTFPSSPRISGPHSKLYESWFGMLEPARDFSVFDMSWVGPAASLVSTVADLNRFYRLLLEGEIVSVPMLEQMQRTGPVISFEGTTIEYGLGLHRFDVPGHGTYWGHDGTAWGAGALSMTSVDTSRQFSLALNRMRYNQLDDAGRPQPHPIDAALARLQGVAVGGALAAV